jgi:hypothetical protein
MRALSRGLPSSSLDRVGCLTSKQLRPHVVFSCTVVPLVVLSRVSKQERKEHRRQTPAYFALVVLLGFLHFGGASATIARTKQPMGSSSKEHSLSSTSASGGVSFKRVKGESFDRNPKDARRLKLLNGGKPCIRGKQGVIIHAAEYPNGEGRDQAGPGCS